MKKLLLIFVISLFTFSSQAQFLIKFSPTQAILSNEIGLAYEHRVRSKISVEVQAGTTFSKVLVPLEDYFEKRRSENFLQNNAWGVFGGVSMRYYLLGYNVAPAGFYLGTLYKYRLFHSYYTSEFSSIGTIKGSNSQFVLQLVCGYQFPFTKLFSMDFYIGLGANFQQAKVPIVISVNDKPTWDMEKRNPTTFAPTIGVKFGFGKSGRELL